MIKAFDVVSFRFIMELHRFSVIFLAQASRQMRDQLPTLFRHYMGINLRPQFGMQISSAPKILVISIYSAFRYI